MPVIEARIILNDLLVGGQIFRVAVIQGLHAEDLILVLLGISHRPLIACERGENAQSGDHCAKEDLAAKKSIHPLHFRSSCGA